MRNKRINKILGTILAITLPLTIIGVLVLTFAGPGNMMKNMHNNMWNGNMMENMHNNMWNENMWNQGNHHMGGKPSGTNSLGSKHKDITKVKVSNLITDIDIRPSNSNETWVEYNGSKNIYVEKQGNTLSVKDRDYKNFGMHMGNGSDIGNTIILYLGNTNIELDMDLPVSKINVSNVSVKSIDIESGVGTVTLDTITAMDKIEVSGGTGQTKLNDITTSKLDIEVGVGKISLDKIQADKADIEGGIGSISINNSKIRELETDTGIGSLTIDNSDIQNHKKH